MKIEQYTVDTFTDKVGGGNPAVVCVTEAPLEDAQIQQIANDNGQVVTAFLVAPAQDGERNARTASFGLRWFTPAGELDLCGHATLAATFVVTQSVRPGVTIVTFDTKSGKLVTTESDGWISLNLPGYRLKSVPVTDEMERALGVRPVEAYLDRDLICVLESESQVRAAKPDAELLAQLDGTMQVITAAGSGDTVAHSVSRCFAPKIGVYEDPASSLAHCAIGPLWSQKLDMVTLWSEQASERGGFMRCGINGSRVLISGHAVLASTDERELG